MEKYIKINPSFSNDDFNQEEGVLTLPIIPSPLKAPFVGMVLKRQVPRGKEVKFYPLLLATEKINLPEVNSPKIKSEHIQCKYKPLFLIDVSKKRERVFPSLVTTNTKLKELWIIFSEQTIEITPIFSKGAKEEDKVNFKERIIDSEAFNYSRTIWVEILINEIETLQKEEDLRKREAEVIRREKKFNEVEKLHKQPRGYLKTTAKLVGKATDEKTLFSLPEVIPESGGNFLREVISRNTAILGNYLLQLWQQSGGEKLVINNLSPIAEIMGNSNYEIKIYLLYLGGYVYPIIDKDKDGLTLTTEQLFKIQFRYSSKVADKYKAVNYTEIGSGLTKFIKDEPIDSITIEPSPLFIKALEGKGLGNVLVVNDKFVKLALSLTDIAYKIFTYSASNKPSQKIAEDNLVKHLGLEKQIKTQGRPRVRATILKGLQELQDKEHIKSYSYEEATGMYLFTYSDKYVKHQELKKGK